jgi:GxxExxY protein
LKLHRESVSDLDRHVTAPFIYLNVAIMSQKYLYIDLTEKIIEACFEVHRELGPGFQEIIYHNALKLALSKKGLTFETEKEFEVRFFNKVIGTHRVDLVVERKVIVEIKAVAGRLPELFKAQVISYLKASGLEIGLLINFGNEKLDIKRLARYKDYKKH